MARPVDTRGGGKKRKPLNASLPTQLVLDFNAAASKQGNGKRDALLQEVLLSFLATAHPESKSIRRLGIPEQGALRGATVSAPEAARLMDRMKEREALRVSRECAEKILKVTAEAVRKGPKTSAKNVARRGRKAS